MKKLFIQLVGRLKENDLIESDYKIISNGKHYATDQLNVDNIAEGFILSEKFNL